MKFAIQREALLKPLQLVAGVVEKRQTLPILSNVLITLENGQLSLTGTDLEVELVARTTVDSAEENGEITLPARKLVDIMRNLPEDSMVEVRVQDQRAVIKTGRSRFTLATLPASEFPNVEEVQATSRFQAPQRDLRFLIEHTQFAMAQQDVRYYLNGMLFETQPDLLRTVATDGHRLAVCDKAMALSNVAATQVIVPRKGVLELHRLLETSDEPVEVILGSNHIRVIGPLFSFTSKLVDGRFPDYGAVLPKNGDKILVGGREEMRQALQRAAILSNEKYRGIRLQLSAGTLKVMANNPEQEEAEEEIEVNYDGEELEIGFNVGYLLDVLNALGTDSVKVTLKDADSSADLRADGDDSCRYVVMPMRL